MIRYSVIIPAIFYILIFSSGFQADAQEIGKEYIFQVLTSECMGIDNRAGQKTLGVKAKGTRGLLVNLHDVLGCQNITISWPSSREHTSMASNFAIELVSLDHGLATIVPMNNKDSYFLNTNWGFSVDTTMYSGSAGNMRSFENDNKYSDQLMEVTIFKKDSLVKVLEKETIKRIEYRGSPVMSNKGYVVNGTTEWGSSSNALFIERDSLVLLGISQIRISAGVFVVPLIEDIIGKMMPIPSRLKNVPNHIDLWSLLDDKGKLDARHSLVQYKADMKRRPHNSNIKIPKKLQEPLKTTIKDDQTYRFNYITEDLNEKDLFVRVNNEKTPLIDFFLLQVLNMRDENKNDYFLKKTTDRFFYFHQALAVNGEGAPSVSKINGSYIEKLAPLTSAFIGLYMKYYYDFPVSTVFSDDLSIIIDSLQVRMNSVSSYTKLDRELFKRYDIRRRFNGLVEAIFEESTLDIYYEQAKSYIDEYRWNRAYAAIKVMAGIRIYDPRIVELIEYMKDVRESRNYQLFLTLSEILSKDKVSNPDLNECLALRGKVDPIGALSDTMQWVDNRINELVGEKEEVMIRHDAKDFLELSRVSTLIQGLGQEARNRDSKLASFDYQAYYKPDSQALVIDIHLLSGRNLDASFISSDYVAWDFATGGYKSDGIKGSVELIAQVVSALHKKKPIGPKSLVVELMGTADAQKYDGRFVYDGAFGSLCLDERVKAVCRVQDKLQKGGECVDYFIEDNCFQNNYLLGHLRGVFTKEVFDRSIDQSIPRYEYTYDFYQPRWYQSNTGSNYRSVGMRITLNQYLADEVESMDPKLKERVLGLVKPLPQVMDILN